MNIQQNNDIIQMIKTNVNKFYETIRSIFTDQFRKSQVKSLALVVTAILLAREVTSTVIGEAIAQLEGIQKKSGMNRFHRLLRNMRVTVEGIGFALLKFLDLVGFLKGIRLIVSLDWTDWSKSLRFLIASIGIDSRAVPILARRYDREVKEVGSKNKVENEFVERLKEFASKLGKRLLILADRGFNRRSLIRLLKSKGIDFVVRLTKNIKVRVKGKEFLLKDSKLKPGMVRDYGEVRIGSERKVKERVKVRVIGVWAKGQKEPWWLATNLEGRVEEIIALYDRRFSIEEQFRDEKNGRFGLGLQWTEFKESIRIEKLIVLVGVAMVVWYSVGGCEAKKDPTSRLESKKGYGLSLLRVGMDTLTNPIGCLNYLGKVTVQFIAKYMPKVRFRIFQWVIEYINHNPTLRKQRKSDRSVLRDVRHIKIYCDPKPRDNYKRTKRRKGHKS